MNSFTLEVVTPDGRAFSGEARSLVVRTSEGDVEILAGHTDYLATISTGKAKITNSEGNVSLAAVSGGFISVCNGSVRLVVTTFEYADQIDVSRAKKAKERAEAAIKAAKDEKEMRIAKAKLSRALARISVGKS